MINIYPAYYKAFKCLAGACPDTCCVSWQVTVDGESLKKYRTLSGETGEKIRANLATDADGDSYFKLTAGRCPFLTESGLCEIHSGAGEDYLCKTCRDFPKYKTIFGARIYHGLGLGCPAAARLIISEDFSLIKTEDGAAPQPNETDAEFFMKLLKNTEESVSLFKSSLPFEEVIKKFLVLQGGKNGGALIKFFFENEDVFSPVFSLDFLSENSRKKITKIKGFSGRKIFGSKEEKYFKNLMLYYIYRYSLLPALSPVFDPAAALAVFSALCIAAMCESEDDFSPEKICENAVVFSKETEYSEENLFNLLLALRSIK